MIIAPIFVFTYFLLFSFQWNPVIRSRMGQNTELAVLMGWPCYRGRLKFSDVQAVDKYTVHRIRNS